MKKTDVGYRWLNETGQVWKIDFEIVPAVVLIAGVPVAIALAVAVPIWGLRVLVLGLVHLVVYLMLAGVSYYLLYWRIRCPACGHNPTRRKADGKPMSTRALFPRLQRLDACPCCGDAAAG